ncbi:hypothetical protein ACFW9V_22750 [Streptomyces hygroscopicus]|uniref:hypothetical protein n=1 Tax=Streptomyces hygroscopicus TaxID=1912 RepID=UPI00369A30C3
MRLSTGKELPWFVDGRGFTWQPVTGDGERYEAHNKIPKNSYTPAELATLRGPVRKIAAPQPEDMQLVRDALTIAGTKALATLAVALMHGSKAGRDCTGHPGALVAGCPGSWESQTVRLLVWQTGPVIEAEQTHPEALAVLRDVIIRWVAGDPMVEVAGSLAHALVAVTQQQGGFEQISDSRLHDYALSNRYARYATYGSP